MKTDGWIKFVSTPERKKAFEDARKKWIKDLIEEMRRKK